MSKLKKFSFYYIIIILVIIDQITKFGIINNLDNLPSVVIKNVLRFTYCENTGVAFSIGDGNVVIFAILNIILICGLIFYYEKSKNDFTLSTKVCISCVIAGGFSNLLDRIFRGFVVDFIDINQLFKFPIFNVADVYIVIGIFGLCCFYVAEIFRDKR